MNLQKLLFGLSIVLTMQLVSAQETSIARITTEIVPPIIVEEIKRMRFGTFAIDSNEGSIILSAHNERIATGSIKLIESQYNAGKFTVFSTPGSLVTLSLPKTSLSFVLDNGRFCFTLDNFNACIPESGMFICQKNGKTEVNVGATLHSVPPSKGFTGTNRNTYEVVFLYN